MATKKTPSKTAKKAAPKKAAAKPQPKIDPNTGNSTTGHSWDGIEEYNNPLPLWWLWVWAACIVFSIGYVIYFPAIPFVGGNFSQGVGGWSQYQQLQNQLDAGNAKKAVFEEQISQLSVHDIKQNPDLYEYAIAAGKSQFAINCSQCHGAGAAGAKGYPSLLDNEWIWGGKLEDILYTITHGVRSTHEDEESRDMGPMMAFGDEEVLTHEEVKDVVYHVKRLANPKLPETEGSARGKGIYADNCASCHGDMGNGNRELGAPPLNNHIWLYGGSTESLVETVAHGRAGQMPAFGLRLDADTIKKLALYVRSLGGAED